MVRIIFTLVVASILGFVLGKFQANLATNGVVEQFQTVQPTVAVTSLESTNSLAVPKVELPDGNSFEFGQMRHGSSMSHSFKVRNAGDGVLRLAVIDSTCKCTVGDLKKGDLQPGEETEITLTWRGPKVAAHFGQTATVSTTDPSQPEIQFRIEGSVIDSFVFEPTEIELGDFGPDASMTKEFKVYSYGDKDVELSQMKWTRPDTQEKIAINFEEVEVDRAGKHAKASRAYRATLDIQPGMPVGMLASSIAFLTNLGDQVDPLELPVHGRVTSDLSIIGGTYFDTEKNILTIGKVPRGEEFSTSIWIALRGEQAEGFEATFEQLDAEKSLQVKVGEPSNVGDRTLIPIEFTVPKSAPDAYYPGNSKDSFARVIVRSNSSKLPELPIRVRLIVEEHK